MTVAELIEQLAARGIDATAAQIEAELGSTEHLTADDIPAIAEMLSATSSRSKGRKGKSQLAKSTPKADLASIQKVDANNLPQVANLAASQVTQLIQQVEAMQADGAEQDDRLAAFLTDLYNRQQELTGFLVRAKSALIEGNGAMVAAANDLNGAVEKSMSGLVSTGQVLAQVAEGAQLGASFRSRSGKLASFFHPAVAPNEAKSAA